MQHLVKLMVRQEENNRERKRAAAGCRSLESFVVKLPKQDAGGTAAVDSVVGTQPSSSTQQVLPYVQHQHHQRNLLMTLDV